jgi:hypothetical protein
MHKSIKHLSCKIANDHFLDPMVNPMLVEKKYVAFGDKKHILFLSVKQNKSSYTDNDNNRNEHRCEPLNYINGSHEAGEKVIR